MTKKDLIAVLVAGSLAGSADAGVLGFASFSRFAENGNAIVDLVAVTERTSDRVLSVLNVNTSSTFIHQASLSARGFRPDTASSHRSNAVDSFVTIGVQGGAPYYGEYYAAGNTGLVSCVDFASCWPGMSTASTMPANFGWSISPPTGPDNFSESLANFSGLRANSSSAAAGGSFGVWLGHWVFAGGTTSAVISCTVAVKDGVSGATVTGVATNFDQLPAPGVLAVLGIAGIASRRRRA